MPIRKTLSKRQSEVLTPAWRHYFCFGEEGLWDREGPVDTASDHSDVWALFMVTGRNGQGAHPETLRRWALHRDGIIKTWITEHPGSRPWAWWMIEAPAPRDPGETELDYLRRHGLLTKAELKNEDSLYA